MIRNGSIADVSMRQFSVQVRPGWSLLPAVALALSLMGGGSLAAFISFLVLAGSGQKSHAPPHSPPQSDVDVESEQGELNEAYNPKPRPELRNVS